MSEKIDWRAKRWEMDIRHFSDRKERFLAFQAKFPNSPVLVYLHERMIEIQERWPQFIKKEEIPSLET